MNYWFAEMTGMGSLTLPVFDMIEVNCPASPIDVLFDRTLENMGSSGRIYRRGLIQHHTRLDDS